MIARSLLLPCHAPLSPAYIDSPPSLIRTTDGTGAFITGSSSFVRNIDSVPLRWAYGSSVRTVCAGRIWVYRYSGNISRNQCRRKCPRKWFVGARRISSIGVIIKFKRSLHLPYTCGAIRISRFRSRAIETRQHHARKKPDNRNHDEQLNQGKTLLPHLPQLYHVQAT